jgi:inner membrane protein
VLVALLVVLAVDTALALLPEPLVVLALLDWTAHVATALVALAALRRRLPAPFVVATLLGASLIDLDHLPAQLGSSWLTAGTPRPYTHSLATVAVLGLAAAVAATIAARGRSARGARASARRARPVLAGLAFGVLAHLLRDLGTGPGVPLLWPLTRHAVAVPYSAYLAAVVVLVAVAWAGGRRGLVTDSS